MVTILTFSYVKASFAKLFFFLLFHFSAYRRCLQVKHRTAKKKRRRCCILFARYKAVFKISLRLTVCPGVQVRRLWVSVMSNCNAFLIMNALAFTPGNHKCCQIPKKLEDLENLRPSKNKSKRPRYTLSWKRWISVTVVWTKSNYFHNAEEGWKCFDNWTV